MEKSYYMRELQLQENDLSGSVPVAICDSVVATDLAVSVDCDRVQCDCGCTCFGQDDSTATTTAGG